jgi:hypothetical protein
MKRSVILEPDSFAAYIRERGGVLAIADQVYVVG